MKVRVEFEPVPIRHIAVQCPSCLKWFNGWDIVSAEHPFRDLRYAHDIEFATFHCPICDDDFGDCNPYDRTHVKIEEVGSADECYKGCLRKKETWE